MNATDELPVVVIGAGPVGLAAAAHLLERGLEPLILEAGAQVGASIRQWGHVKLFSPWRYLSDRTATSLLARSGWQPPEPEEYPTGAQLVSRYLEPLAELPEIARALRLRHEVTAVSRLGFDRMKTPGRDESPFLVVVRGPQGEVRVRAQAVIDASGTWSAPNPAGAEGIPADGEREFQARIRYGIPDARGGDRERYRGRRTLVVGGGHSAQNAVLELAALKRESVSGEVLWAVRRGDTGALFGGGESDELPERAALGSRAHSLVDAGEVELLAGFRVERMDDDSGKLRIAAADGRAVVADELVVATGFRPQLRMHRELRLELDFVTEAPVRLAPLIDPNVHSCGTVPPHGEAELAHPERGFYMVGMKSYGRAPTFLLLTGYEQVRSVAAYLAGDLEAARKVELTLPDTGVCCGEGGCEVPAATTGSAVVGASCAAPTVKEPQPQELVVVGSGGSCC